MHVTEQQPGRLLRLTVAPGEAEIEWSGCIPGCMLSLLATILAGALFTEARDTAILITWGVLGFFVLISLVFVFIGESVLDIRVERESHLVKWSETTYRGKVVERELRVDPDLGIRLKLGSRNGLRRKVTLYPEGGIGSLEFMVDLLTGGEDFLDLGRRFADALGLPVEKAAGDEVRYMSGPGAKVPPPGEPVEYGGAWLVSAESESDPSDGWEKRVGLRVRPDGSLVIRRAAFGVWVSFAGFTGGGFYWLYHVYSWRSEFSDVGFAFAMGGLSLLVACSLFMGLGYSAWSRSRRMDVESGSNRVRLRTRTERVTIDPAEVLAVIVPPDKDKSAGLMTTRGLVDVPHDDDSTDGNRSIKAVGRILARQFGVPLRLFRPGE